MGDKHKYIELVPSTVLPTLRGEDGNNYIEFETHLRIVNKAYESLNKQGHETARILNLCDDKDAEIEKYKKTFESSKCERDKMAREYQNKIDRLKSRISELEESQEELPFEPICVAEYLMDRTIEVKNTFPALQGGETSHVPVYDVSELRQIAEHLLVYCKYHSEEKLYANAT